MNIYCNGSGGAYEKLTQIESSGEYFMISGEDTGSIDNYLMRIGELQQRNE